jgi:hypothetical protein
MRIAPQITDGLRSLENEDGGQSQAKGERRVVLEAASDAINHEASLCPKDSLWVQERMKIRE